MRRIVVGMLAALAITWGTASAVARTPDSRPLAAVGGASTTKTYDAVCATDGQIAIKPGLTTNPHRQTVTVTGEILAGPGCPNGPGTLSGTLHAPSAGCSDRGLEGSTASGTLTVTWADATTAELAVGGDVIHARNSRAFAFWVFGQVRGGIDAHDKVVMIGTLSPWPCGTSRITSGDFTADDGKLETPLTLWHFSPASSPRR